MFQACGQWNVPSLWPMEGEGKTPFHFLPLSPQ
jgi:hypothetical protein